MKKIFTFLFLTSVCGAHLLAQDKIYKKNGDVIEAKVIEIGEAEIKYKIFKDIEGPLYSVDKDRLIKIVYQGGREETYQHSLKDKELYADQTKNAIKLNFLSPLGGYTQINFEHNIRPGRSYEYSLGLIGLGKRQSYDEYSSSLGGSTNYYRGAAGAYLGLGYKFIKLPDFVRNGEKYSHVLQGAYAKPEVVLGVYGQNKYRSATEKETVSMGALIINLGKQWVLGDAFLIDLYGGLGYGIDSQTNSDFFDGYGGNDFGLIITDGGLGFTGGLKLGLLLNKKKK